VRLTHFSAGCYIVKHAAEVAQLVEQTIRNVPLMSRGPVFSAIYGGISRVKRHHSGAVGSVLGNKLGKDFRC
jgi:hypothetical protein